MKDSNNLGEASTESALLQSEERLRSFIAASNNMVYRMNTDWTRMDNLVGKELLADTSEPSTGWIDKYILPEDQPHVQSVIQQAIMNKSIFELEHRVILSDGSIGWVHSRATPLFNVRGEITEWFGAGTNITERKQIEKALEESEERLQLSLKGANIFTWDVNPETGETNHSSNAAEMLGFEIGKKSYENFSYIHPDDKEFVLSAIKLALQGKAPLDVEHRIINPENREEMWVRAQGQLMKKDSDKYSFLGITQDITKRKQAEEALHLSEDRCSIALQSAEMAAWDWNLESDIVEWNDQHYYLLGLQPSDVIKTSAFFLKFIHPDDVQKVSDELTQAVTETGFYHTEFRVIRKDGQVKWMSGYGRVVDKRGGKAKRMAGVMFDITRSKLLEQQKEGFISIASHELKTPVTSIKAYGEILQESLDEAGDPANAELVKKMNVQIDRLTALINALLDTTKISEGQLPLNIETFGLNDLVQERVEDLQRITPSHLIVWDLCQDVLIQADRERIGQVFTNLVSNAIKYSPKGGEVRISCQIRQDGVLLVGVQDWGVGIPKEMRDRVFERFFRIPDVRVRNYPGMGLGLYITAGIIHRHSGKIWVESEPGEGSTFYFTLPV